MIIPSGAVRVLVATRPVDFRKGTDGLCALVQESLRSDPYSGVIYVFRAKRADRVKLLLWDGGRNRTTVCQHDPEKYKARVGKKDSLDAPAGFLQHCSRTRRKFLEMRLDCRKLACWQVFQQVVPDGGRRRRPKLYEVCFPDARRGTR